MALTRITQGVIKPNENYDTHNINSTGIVTATGLNISGNASIGGVLTYEDVTNIDAIGIITARSGVDVDDFLSVGSNIHLGNAGIVTATSFSGDGSGLTGLSADKIFEGNTKAEVSDTGTNGRFFVETEGAEKFSIDSVGNFTFNKAHDNVINADGDITINYKMSNSTKIRNFTKSGGFYFYPMSDTYPFVIGSGFGSDEIEIYRTGEVKVGSGITLSGSTGNIIATGIVTASNFVGDGVTFSTSGNHITGITTFADDIKFGDDKKIIIGTGGDFEIYHDTANRSGVRFTNPEFRLMAAGNTGNIQFGVSNSATELSYQTLMAEFKKGAECSLRFNGSTKLATSNTGITVSGSVTDDKGNLRSLPQNNTTGSYTLVASDAGKHVRATGQITVPSGTFSTGDMITIYNNSGSTITIVQGSSTTVYNSNDASTGNKTLKARGLCTILCESNNGFVASGNFE